MLSYSAQNKVDQRTCKSRLGRHLLKGQIINKSAQNAAQEDPDSIYTKNYMRKLSKIFAEHGHVIFSYCNDQRSLNLLLKFLRQHSQTHCLVLTDEGLKVFVGQPSTESLNWLASINARGHQYQFLTSVKEKENTQNLIAETNRFNNFQGFRYDL